MDKTPNVSPKFASSFGGVFIEAGFDEVVVPALWEQQTFVQKAGVEITKQMYAFDDKKGRPICLIPEVTAPLQELWRNQWSQQGKPMRLFYAARCYRYETPQRARYREFTQLGVELLGGKQPEDKAEVVETLTRFLDLLDIPYQLDCSVRRGLSYYVEDGFEARCNLLGAQKQVAGGGRYAEGIGWAVGLDRVLVAQSSSSTG